MADGPNFGAGRRVSNVYQFPVVRQGDRHPDADPGAVRPTVAAPVERFAMFIDRATRRRAYLTPHGKAWRINGLWFVARDGRAPMYVSNPELRAALDTNEQAYR